MVPYEALLITTTRNPAPSRHLAVDRREAVLVADRRADRRESGCRDRVHAAPRRPVDRHLVDRRDPRQLLRKGTYSPNGTSFTFSYRSTELPVAVEQATLVRSVPSGSSVTAPATSARRRSRSPGSTRPLCRDPDGPRDRALPPPRRRGRADRPPARDAASMFSRATARPRPPDESWPPVDVDLRRGDVERGRPERDRDQRGARTRAGGKAECCRPAPPSTAATASTSSAFTTITREGQPHTPPMDARGRCGGVDLGHAELPQPNPPSGHASRIHPSRSTGPPARAPSTGRSRRHTAGATARTRATEPRRHHERRPRELAERQIQYRCAPK